MTLPQSATHFLQLSLAGVALASRFAHDENGYRCHKSAECD